MTFDARGEALHELDVQLPEASNAHHQHAFASSRSYGKAKNSPVTGGSDEVEHGVDAVVPETRVTLDTGLLGKDVIVLPLEVANNL